MTIGLVICLSVYLALVPCIDEHQEQRKSFDEDDDPSSTILDPILPQTELRPHHWSLGIRNMGAVYEQAGSTLIHTATRHLYVLFQKFLLPRQL